MKTPSAKELEQGWAKKKIQKASARVMTDQIRLEIAMEDGHAAGLSLREIAQAADVSHEQVRRVLVRRLSA